MARGNKFWERRSPLRLFGPAFRFKCRTGVRRTQKSRVLEAK